MPTPTTHIDPPRAGPIRHAAGERAHWRVLHVPTVEEEDRRHVHRELARLTQGRTRAVNRIKGLLAAHGLRLTSLRALPDQLPHLTQWDHTPLPPAFASGCSSTGRGSRCLGRSSLAG